MCEQNKLMISLVFSLRMVQMKGKSKSETCKEITKKKKKMVGILQNWLQFDK